MRRAAAHGQGQRARSASAVDGCDHEGKGTAWPLFQEVMGLDAGSGTVAVAIWTNAKTGTPDHGLAFGG
jgi:hypothetical protein